MIPTPIVLVIVSRGDGSTSTTSDGVTMLDGDERILPELEALLRGTYVEYLERRGHHVPPWAWINLLAHGSEDALRRAARTRRRRFFNVDVWRHARGYLAGEVIAAAQRAGSLREIQTTVLVPLELEHLSAPPARRTRPGQWAIWILTAIEHSNITRRPGS